MSDDVIVTPESLGVPEEALWYTPGEVGKLFRVDSRTVVRWERNQLMAKYNVKVIKTPGGHRRYYKEDIIRLYYELNPEVPISGD
jgi:signal peptidase I